MTIIKNHIGSPYDIQTLQGPRVLDAFGTLEADFDTAYLSLLSLGGHITVVDGEQVEAVEVAAPELTPELTPAETYEALAGKPADKRWSDARLTDEIAKLTKDA